MRSPFARRPPIAPIISIAVLVGMTFAGVAGAADAVAVPNLQTESVDARGETTSIDVINTGVADPGKLEVKADGESVRSTVQSFADSGRGSNVIVVIDNSKAMGNGAVQLAKKALAQLAPGTGGINALGVVTIGGGARLTVPLTRSQHTVESLSRPIAPGGSPALWDGVALAADTLGTDQQSNNHQIVLVTGTADAVSRAKYPEVEQALRSSGSLLHVVALPGGSPDVESLQSLVRNAGGSYQVGTSNDLASLYTVVGNQLSHQFTVTTPGVAASEQELHELELDWAGVTSKVGYQAGQLNVGADALAPIDNSLSIFDRMATSDVTKWLIVLLGMASAGMIVYSIAMLVSRRSEGLSFALRHYDGYVEDEEIWDDDAAPSIAGNNQFLKKAVVVTGDLAERQGGLTKIADLLERADLPLRPAEALFFYAAGVAVAGIAAALVSGDFLVLVMVLLIALLAPNFFVKFRVKRRSKKFVAQLPDMLQLLSGTLRAGYSIAQGFEAVSGEIDDPMGRELRRVMAEARLGRPIEDALDAAAVRTGSEDFGWAVMAIRIQREVGGNLAELLMTVADTMTQRERLRRDVASLTAEGRMSAMVLGCLPPGLAAVMWVMNPEYIGRLTNDTIGLILLVVAGVSMLIGFAWMKKIINIEI